MRSEEILPKLLEYFENYSSDTLISELDPQDSLIEYGILNSHAIVELMIYLERIFEIVIPNEDMTRENFDSLLDIASYLAKRVGS